MKRFFITFSIPSPLWRGWVEIESDDEDTARAAARSIFGVKFSGFYTEDLFTPDYFPAGRYGEVVSVTKNEYATTQKEL